MPVAITNTTIAKAKSDAKPGADRYDVRDSKARGLELRVGARGATWALRYQLHGRFTRQALGDVDYWTLTEVRDLVNEAQKLIRSREGIPDDAWVDRYKVRSGKVKPEAVEPRTQPHLLFKWTFEEGVKHYLEAVQGHLARATWQDYGWKLKGKDLADFNRRPVSSITRIDMATAIADIHRSGRETHAENTVRSVTAFWSWLEGDTQIKKSGVTPRIMHGLQAPPRSRKPSKRQVADPTLEDLPRIVALARAGVMEPVICCAIELTVWSVQRRRAVALAQVQDFRAIGDGTEGLWYVFADDRKRDDGEAHVVPLPAPAWSCVQRAIAAGDGGDFLFPAFRERRKGTGAGNLHEHTITHSMSYLPGCQSSPHDVRRIFASYGERMLGISRPMTKLILDHSEGGTRSDVTGKHYALHDGSHDKWPIMRKWSAVLEPEIEKAMAALEPIEEIKAAIASIRYGDGDPKRIAAE